MGKRSSFERRERDFYPTPYEAVPPLLPHITSNSFIEPCAGDGSLVNHFLRSGLYCARSMDIEPKANFILKEDAMKCKEVNHMIITNPPWSRDILHPMINHFRNLNDTWLLFDADWMHTKQSAEYMSFCHKIVSVGRLKWIPDSNSCGKDNCAWYLFKKEIGQTVFIGR
jgi:hypothetical protein